MGWDVSHRYRAPQTDPPARRCPTWAGAVPRPGLPLGLQPSRARIAGTGGGRWRCFRWSGVSWSHVHSGSSTRAQPTRHIVRTARLGSCPRCSPPSHRARQARARTRLSAHGRRCSPPAARGPERPVARGSGRRRGAHTALQLHALVSSSPRSGSPSACCTCTGGDASVGLSGRLRLGGRIPRGVATT